MINPEWMYYFIEVAKLSSTNLVANKLYISQSTISRSISQLEKNLNIKLFHRTYAGMLLTEEGQKLLPYAKQYLKSYQQLLTTAEGFTNKNTSLEIMNTERIHIYSSPGVTNYFDPAILQLPNIDTANIHFYSVPQDETEFNELFLKPNSFVLLLSTNLLKKNIAKDLQIDTLYTSKLHVFCAKNTKFFPSNTKTATIKSLRKLPFIIHSTGNFMNTVMTDIFKDKKPSITLEPNINLLMQHVINDTKISLSVDIFNHVKYPNAVQSSSYIDTNINIHTQTIPISTKIYAELLLIYKPEFLSTNMQDFIIALKELF